VREKGKRRRKRKRKSKSSEEQSDDYQGECRHIYK
jgi:hypothetical protein